MTPILRAKRRLVLPMLLPALALYGIFFVYPIADTFRLSLTDWDGVSPPSFVGLEQYGRLLGDRIFRASLGNAAVLAIIGFALTFPAAIALAWALRQRIRGRRYFQFVVFAPAVVSVTVTAILWKFIYYPNIGLLNATLDAAGLSQFEHPWLGDPHFVLVAIAIATAWQGMGQWVILVGSGMDNLPTEVIEAARADGANELQVLRFVVLPLIGELLRVLAAYYFIVILQTFALVFILTVGGPFNSSEVPGTYIYHVAIGTSQFGYAAAMGIVVAVLILLVVALGSRLRRGE